MDLNEKQIEALTIIAISGRDTRVHHSTVRALIKRGLVEGIAWTPETPLHAPTLRVTEAGWAALPEDVAHRTRQVIRQDRLRAAQAEGRSPGARGDGIGGVRG